MRSVAWSQSGIVLVLPIALRLNETLKLAGSVTSLIIFLTVIGLNFLGPKKT